MICRIQDRATFASFARGRRGSCGPLRLRYVGIGDLLEGSPGARVAYAINRKVGSAVTRNRVRRRLRAAVVELDRSGVEAMPPGAYLFSADATVAELPSAEVRRLVGCVVDRVCRHG